MNYFKSKSLFSEKITELRSSEGVLIGMIEEIADKCFKATNYLKLTSTSYTFENAEFFILASFNNKKSVQSKISKNQIQMF